MKFSWYTYLFAGFIIIVLAGTLFIFLRGSKTIVDDVAGRDIVTLKQIFTRINDKCSIISFDYEKNVVDFLTVKAFVGSEVGTMNLAYAKNWEGPYIADNPEIGGIYYQIVKTAKGYFLTPGDGVKLSNGKVVGKDIVLSYDSDIEALATKPDAFLGYNRLPLAAKIPVRGA